MLLLVLEDPGHGRGFDDEQDIALCEEDGSDDESGSLLSEGDCESEELPGRHVRSNKNMWRCVGCRGN